MRTWAQILRLAERRQVSLNVFDDESGPWESCAVGEVTGARKLVIGLNHFSDNEKRFNVGSAVNPSRYSRRLFDMGREFHGAVQEGRVDVARKLRARIRKQWNSLAPLTRAKVKQRIRAAVAA